MKKLFNNKKAIIGGGILLLFLVIGITYAVVVWTSTNYNVTLNTSCFDVDYILGQDINSVLNPAIVGLGSDNTITINSDMTFSTVSLSFDSECTRYAGIATIELNTTVLNNAFTTNGNSTGSLQYYLIPYDPSEYPVVDMEHLEGESLTYVTNGSIISTGVKDIYSTSLGPNQTKNYIIVFLIDSELVDTDVIGASFASRVNARVVQELGTPVTDFEYLLDTENSTVTLYRYNGNSNTVSVPSIYIIDGVPYNTILDQTFNGNTNIETVYLSEAINQESIENLFSDCTSLQNVPVIPSSVDDMRGTFYNCTSLVNTPAIPNNVVNLDYTFSGCTSLVNAPTIPNSVEDMPGTFNGCTSLVNAPAIPNSVINMSYAFSDCTSLVNAPTIGNSVTTLQGTFAGCTALETAPVIPNTVTNLDSTFYNCTSLVTAPAIPSSVTNMYNTFDSCTNLTGTVRINSCDAYLENAFYGTTKNITLEVPSNSYTAYWVYEPANVTVSGYENNACEPYSYGG